MKHTILILFLVIPASFQHQLQLFESLVKLSALGTLFQPRNPIELLATLSNVRFLLQCVMQCNQNRRCRTFDYDQSSMFCRLFEGDIITGTVLNSSSASSQIGSIQLSNPDVLEQYSSYNQTCDQCSIGTNRYLQCVSNTCQCPQNTYWNQQLCLNQLHSGSPCNSSSSCRQDLNLTCSTTTKTCMVSTRGAWSFVGAMTSGREDHTASLLGNGRVLVTGGYNMGYLNSAEFYDPSTTVWSVTGAMNIARKRHTATLLSNGTVLVAGGDNGGYLNSAELYDPSTGLWRVTSAMNTTRSEHTASLLVNGTVLVAGGWTGSNCLNSAELYDPRTGIWRVTGAMNTARYGHTVSLLGNGTVLVAGGYGISGFLNSVEWYDPGTGVWRVTGAMNTTRYGHTVSLLSNGTVLVAGGYGSSGYLNSVELYDPWTGVWRVTAAINNARYRHTALVLGNTSLLVTGGYGSSGYLKSAELFDP